MAKSTMSGYWYPNRNTTEVLHTTPACKVRTRKILTFLFTIITLGYVLACGYLYFFQRSIIYLPTREEILSPHFYGMPTTDRIDLVTEDQIKLTAWYHPAAQTQKTIVYFQGNNGNVRYRSEKLNAFIDNGFGILAVNYRGYGDSEGSPSEQGLYTDARTAIEYLNITNHIPLQNMIFYGESLGSGIAVQMGTEFAPSAIVLESPYTSLADVAKYRYPIIPIHWLLKDTFDSISKITSIHSPLLVLHGYLDKVIPISQGKTLLTQAKTKKEGRFFTQYDHTNIDYSTIAISVREFSNHLQQSSLFE